MGKEYGEKEEQGLFLLGKDLLLLLLDLAGGLHLEEGEVRMNKENGSPSDLHSSQLICIIFI